MQYTWYFYIVVRSVIHTTIRLYHIPSTILAKTHSTDMEYTKPTAEAPAPASASSSSTDEREPSGGRVLLHQKAYPAPQPEKYFTIYCTAIVPHIPQSHLELRLVATRIFCLSAISSRSKQTSCGRDTLSTRYSKSYTTCLLTQKHEFWKRNWKTHCHQLG